MKIDELKHELQEKNTRVPSYIENSASLYLRQDYTDKARSLNTKEGKRIVTDEEERPRTTERSGNPLRITLKSSQKAYAPKNEFAPDKEGQPQTNKDSKNQGSGKFDLIKIVEGALIDNNVEDMESESDETHKLRMNQYKNLLKGIVLLNLYSYRLRLNNVVKLMHELFHIYHLI